MGSDSINNCTNWVKIKYFILIFAVGILSACGDDENDITFEFINQNLQGQIGGIEWGLVAGKAQDFTTNNDFLSMEMVGVAVVDTCQLSLPNTSKIFFEVPKQVGLYELKVGLQNPGITQTVTFFVAAENQNYIASQGAIEILEIDLENELLEGRLDARVDNQNFINGNFCLVLCD